MSCATAAGPSAAGSPTPTARHASSSGGSATRSRSSSPVRRTRPIAWSRCSPDGSTTPSSRRPVRRRRSVAVTHPANWTEFQRHLLSTALEQAGVPSAALIPEPQAATIDFGSVAHMEPGQLVLVYDLGGGTFDVAILQRDDRGVHQRRRPGRRRAPRRDRLRRGRLRARPRLRPSGGDRAGPQRPDRSPRPGPAAGPVRRGQGIAVQRRLGRHPRAPARPVVDGPAHPPGARGHGPPDAAPDRRAGPAGPRPGPGQLGAAVGGAARRRLVADPAGLRAGRVDARRAGARRRPPEAGGRPRRGALGGDAAGEHRGAGAESPGATGGTASSTTTTRSARAGGAS